MKKLLSIILLLLCVIQTVIPVSAGQQLGNLDFEKGEASPWQTVVSGGGELTSEVSNGSFNITIVNPGGKAKGGADRWDCQLRYRDLVITEGHSYELTWSIFPSEDGFIYTKIGNYDGDIEVWHNNATNPTEDEFEKSWQSIAVKGGEWNIFESAFTATESVDPAEWAFHFGGAGEYQKKDCFPAGTVLQFDNLSLTDLTSDENDFKTTPVIRKNDVRVNQVGYFTNLEKKAMLVVEEGDEEPKEFKLNNRTKVVYTGTTTYFGFDADSGEYLHTIDFSAYIPDKNLKTEDLTKFSIDCNGSRSYLFAIKNDIYNSPEKTSSYIPGSLTEYAMQYFYLNRSGVDIEAENILGDEETKRSLSRKAGHNPDSAYVQPEWLDVYSTPATIDKTNEIDVTGGWYDAGDYGKYIVNGGISLWTLNNNFEFMGGASGTGGNGGTGATEIVTTDNATETSETSTDTATNKATDRATDEVATSAEITETVITPIEYPQILAETKWEMDFFFKMLVKDGDLKDMVYHKVHDYTWTGLALRPEDDDLTRIVKPPSTAATLNFVATAAQMSRLIKDYDLSYAEKCLEQAKISYEAAKLHPAVLAPMNQATGGGAYGDTNVTDEFYWAACELYASTGDGQYLADLMSYENALVTVTNLSGGENQGSSGSFNWGNVASLGNLSLYLNQGKLANLPANDFDVLEKNIIIAADEYINIQKKQGYSLPYKSTTFTDENNAPGQKFTGYEWGSNSFVLNNAMVLAYAYDITNSGGYLNGVISALNYIFGENALDMSFVTGFGNNTAENPHHRYWANSIDESFPAAPAGVLVGGPNSSLADPYIQSTDLKIGDPPQTCYVDNIEAWSVNECTINWNSPLYWVTDFANSAAAGFVLVDSSKNDNPLPVTPDDAAHSEKISKIIMIVCIIFVVGLFALMFIVRNINIKKKND